MNEYKYHIYISKVFEYAADTYIIKTVINTKQRNIINFKF